MDWFGRHCHNAIVIIAINIIRNGDHVSLLVPTVAPTAIIDTIAPVPTATTIPQITSTPRQTSQIIFLRPSCGSIYTVQAGSLLKIRYGSWVAFGKDLSIQNAEHLTVNLMFNDEAFTGVQQPVVPQSEFPCVVIPADNAYGVFYVTQVGPLSAGTYIARQTIIFDERVTDGYDADGDSKPKWYGPGELNTHEFTIIVP